MDDVETVASLHARTQKALNRHQRFMERVTAQVGRPLIAEQKTAKLIELIEELRRDLPIVHDRRDAQAETMSRAVDPENVLSALEEKLDGDDDE